MSNNNCWKQNILGIAVLRKINWNSHNYQQNQFVEFICNDTYCWIISSCAFVRLLILCLVDAAEMGRLLSVKDWNWKFLIGGLQRYKFMFHVVQSNNYFFFFDNCVTNASLALLFSDSVFILFLSLAPSSLHLHYPYIISVPNMILFFP